MNDRTVIEDPSTVATAASVSTAANTVDTTDAFLPPLTEEVETSIRKDGISYFFESRSVSAVTQFVYTPIDGTFSDIELEINNADPIKPAEDGGILVDMGGHILPADSDDIQRHLISCEQVGDCVEARWQWVIDEEQANFLYRFYLVGKSFVVEIEGGNGKASGLALGRVTGALHPRLITVPYFNFGENYPRILCTSDVFVSSFIDWNITQASALFAADEETAVSQLRLNGGCTYLARTDGKRNAMQERWLITASTQFAEVFPTIAKPDQGREETLADKAWFNIPYIDAAEESYVKIYESLRILKQMGIDQLLINHPSETWHDGDGNASYTLEAAAAKGGDDALSEYIDAVSDLGFDTSLLVSYREMAASHPEWNSELSAQLPDGNPVLSSPAHYLVKPTHARDCAADHTRALLDKYQPHMPYLADHAARSPSDFIDCDLRVENGNTLRQSHQLQQMLLTSLRDDGPVIGEGGSHWLYPGLLNGYLARIVGANPSATLPLVDFDLNNLHPLQSDAGLGTIDQYFGGDIAQNDKHSRSDYLLRYLATTAAFGHAVLLPDPVEWGLPAAVKAYFMLQKLQSQYLRVPVATIQYHHNGNLLDSNDALLSGAYEQGQIRIEYQNGTLIFANLSNETWDVLLDETTYGLPPGGFVARGASDDLLVYSADTGSGLVDCATCTDYTFIDTRGQALEQGPISIDGAALVKERKWQIDVVPMDCQMAPIINVAHYWSDRKLPPLRLLAFKADEENPSIHRADMDGGTVKLPQIDGVYMYRITLPEWMVEPGQ